MDNNLVFRKAGRGYNKDDVNNYIVLLNSKLTEAQNRFNKLVRDSNEKATADFNEINRLKDELSQSKELKSTIDEKEKEIEKLKEEIEELKNAEPTVEVKGELNSEEYDNLCAKVGEVLVIASTTADDILKKANEEAERILSDATNQKENLIKNITDTASTEADTLSDYIKGAVDKCILKINRSIRSVDALKDLSDDKLPTINK